MAVAGVATALALGAVSVPMAHADDLKDKQKRVQKKIEHADREFNESSKRLSRAMARMREAKAQLRARFVFDMDGVTDIAHQLGYFETIGSWRDALALGERLEGVGLADVHEAARAAFACSNRTIGWFEPQADACR